MIGQTISHYRILSRLGAGGMGVVYEAEDTRLGRRVAIKFLPDDIAAETEAVQRFLREARVIATLNHPHICTLHDIGEHEGKHFMVMELLEGESLRTRITRGPIPIEEVVALGAQLADALDAAHAKGVVHRDIKPPNLFITPRGQLKVLDFGVAKLNPVRSDRDPGVTQAPSEELTTMGTTIGTISYMSPEQARGQEIDGRSDLFSAGIVLYEMATRQLPFAGATAGGIFEGILTKSHVPPSQVAAGIPPEFDHIVAKALEKDRETRYQGAAELRADLTRLRRTTESGRTMSVATAESRQSSASVPAAAAVPPVRSRARRWAFIGAPLVGLALVAGFYAYRAMTTPALTVKDTVLLAAVVNRTGDTMFDFTIEEALALQLRQSPFLNVVSEQQVQSTLRLMGRDQGTVISSEVGRELCQRVGARALLGGTIAMLGSAYIVTLNAQDCVTGSVIAEQQVQAVSKETVLSALGTGVSALRAQLGESLPSVKDHDVKIEEASTSSLEALKAYSQGVHTRRTQGDFDAVPFFRRAIELDPDFALAYARLGTVYSNLNRSDEGKKMTARAFELRKQVSEAERLYIEGRYYTTVEPDVNKAIETYKLLLATYPNDYAALGNSGMLLKQRGEYEEALQKLEAAARVAPNNPQAWTNLGTTLMEMDRFDEAKKALKSGLAVLDSTAVRASLYSAAARTGDRALADEQMEATRGRRDEMDFTATRVQAATFEGHFKEAAALSADWAQRMEQASRGKSVGAGVMSLAINEAMVGLVDAAKARIKDTKDEGLLGPELGDEQLVAAALMHDAKACRELRPTESIGINRAIEGIALLCEDQFAEAIAKFEPLTFDSGHTDQVFLWSLAHLRAQHWTDAIKGFEWTIGKDSRKELSASAAFSLVSLARAQAGAGQAGDARKSYQKFLDLWKGADPDLPLLVQAKEEFAKLGAGAP